MSAADTTIVAKLAWLADDLDYALDVDRRAILTEAANRIEALEAEVMGLRARLLQPALQRPELERPRFPAGVLDGHTLVDVGEAIGDQVWVTRRGGAMLEVLREAQRQHAAAPTPETAQRCEAIWRTLTPKEQAEARLGETPGIPGEVEWDHEAGPKNSKDGEP